MTERSRMNLQLLITLANAVTANEKTQRKFRNAVLIRLSKIETMGVMIHGAQIAEAERRKPLYEQKVTENAKAAEEFISQKSGDLGLAMIRYIYGKSEIQESRRDRRRRWWGWEI